MNTKIKCSLASFDRNAIKPLSKFDINKSKSIKGT